MCSYEKVGWPGYQDLGFWDRDPGNRAGDFSHMNTPSRIPGRNNFNRVWLVGSLTSQGNCFYTGLTPRFPYSGCFCICVEASWINVMLSRNAGSRVFWAFRTFVISVTGIKFSIWTEDKIRRAYQASPVTGLIWKSPVSRKAHWEIACHLMDKNQYNSKHLFSIV